MWQTSLGTAPERQRQENQKFEASLGYTARLRNRKGERFANNYSSTFLNPSTKEPDRTESLSTHPSSIARPFLKTGRRKPTPS